MEKGVKIDLGEIMRTESEQILSWKLTVEVLGCV